MSTEASELRDGVRDALWMNHAFYAEHILSVHMEPWDACPISAVIKSVGWRVDAFLVASAFDCRDLLDD